MEEILMFISTPMRVIREALENNVINIQDPRYIEYKRKLAEVTKNQFDLLNKDYSLIEIENIINKCFEENFEMEQDNLKCDFLKNGNECHHPAVVKKTLEDCPIITKELGYRFSSVNPCIYVIAEDKNLNQCCYRKVNGEEV